MFTEAKSLNNCFWYNLIVYIVFGADTGNNTKIVNFTYSCLKTLIPLEIRKQLISNLWPWKSKFVKQP